MDITRKGEQVPEPGASSTLPSALSAGNARMTQLTKVNLHRLGSSAIRHIAQALSTHKNFEGDISSTKEEYIGYITRAQQALAARGIDLLGIWKVIKLSEGDLNKLRVETLRTICNSIGARGPGPTATKKDLVKALSKT